MKSLIAVAGLVLCLVVCSHQMRLIEEDGTRLVKVNYTNYALTGPELLKHGLRCASVNGDFVTFWKKDGCNFDMKRMDELGAHELELIKIKEKVLRKRMADHRRIGPRSTITETRSVNHYIDIGSESTATLTDSSDNHITVGSRSTVTMTGSGANHITVDDGATLTITGSNNNKVKVSSGHSSTVTNQQHQVIINGESRPLDKAMVGIGMGNSRIYSLSESDAAKTIVELGDFVAFIMDRDQIQMKPIECLEESEKMLLKPH